MSICKYLSHVSFNSLNNDYYQKVQEPIFILYDLHCSEQSLLNNIWLKPADEQAKDSNNANFFFVDCSVYPDECQKMTKNNKDITIPISLSYSTKTNDYTIIESDIKKKDSIVKSIVNMILFMGI